MRVREAVEGYLFISPWLVGLLVFTLYPFVSGFWYSLSDFDALTPAQWVGLENYRRILVEDELFWKAVYNTVWYTAAYVVPAVVLGLMLAVLLNQKVTGITLFRTLFYLPSIVPSVASIALFMFILHGRFGLLNETLYRLFGIVGPHWLTSPQWTKPSFVLWGLWGVGGGMVIYLAGLQNVPDSLHEAAKIDGAGTIRRFLSITIPMISPTLLFAFVMTVIGSFQIFTPVFLLGSINGITGGPQNSLVFWVVHIYNHAFFYFRMGYASALAWLLFLLLMALTLVQFRLSSKWVYYEGEVADR